MFSVKYIIEIVFLRYLALTMNLVGSSNVWENWRKVDILGRLVTVRIGRIL